MGKDQANVVESLIEKEPNQKKKNKINNNKKEKEIENAKNADRFLPIERFEPKMATEMAATGHSLDVKECEQKKNKKNKNKAKKKQKNSRTKSPKSKKGKRTKNSTSATVRVHYVFSVGIFLQLKSNDFGFQFLINALFYRFFLFFLLNELVNHESRS